MSDWDHANAVLERLAERPAPVPYVPGHGLSAARRHEIATEDAWLRAERQRAAYGSVCADFTFYVHPRGVFRRLVDWFASCLAP